MGKYVNWTNQLDENQEQEQRQLNYGREQMALQTAEQIPDQMMLAQQEDRQDFLKWQQDLRDELEQLKHDLRGEILDPDKGWIQQQILLGYDKEGKEVYEKMPPLMNEIGIRMVETACRPLMSRNMINTRIDERMAYGILRRSMDTIISNIAYYGETQYGMEFGNYSYVVRLVKNVIIPTPFRALKGWTKRMDTTISKRVEAFNTGSTGVKTGKKGLFGIFSQ